jgi:hypothetical protein
MLVIDPLPLAPADLTVGPKHCLIGLDRIGDGLKLALFVGALGAALEIIRARQRGGTGSGHYDFRLCKSVSGGLAISRHCPPRTGKNLRLGLI